MKIDRLNGYTLVAKTNFPFLTYIFLSLTITCGLGFLWLHDAEPKSAFGIGMVIFAILTALITKRCEAVFDSRKNEITLSLGGLVMKTMPPISFNDVKALKIERCTIAGKPYGRLVLVLENTVVSLSPFTEPVAPQLEKNAKQLIRFIGCNEPLSSYDFASQAPRALSRASDPALPFNFDDVDNEVIDLVRKKRLIEAIKLHRSRSGLGLKESKDLVDEIQRRIKNGSM